MRYENVAIPAGLALTVHQMAGLADRDLQPRPGS